MSNSIPIQEILLNQLPVPTKLLTSYKSYGLNEKDVMVILQLLRYLQGNNDFPTPYDIAENLTIDEKESANILRKLIQKNLLSIKQQKNEHNQLSEAYCLDPLWQLLYTKNEVAEEHSEGTIFILFEQEFGRPLSPFEIETVNAWLDEDKIAPSLIKAGLRESVLMGKLNFKYIDRILRDWKKKGIHSVEQAREASRSFHQKKEVIKKDPAANRDTSFYYNWLEGED